MCKRHTTNKEYWNMIAVYGLLFLLTLFTIIGCGPTPQTTLVGPAGETGAPGQDGAKGEKGDPGVNQLPHKLYVYDYTSPKLCFSMLGGKYSSRRISETIVNIYEGSNCTGKVFASLTSDGDDSEILNCNLFVVGLSGSQMHAHFWVYYE